MAAVETMGHSSLGLPEPQTLTEISDDELNLPASEDEEEEEAKESAAEEAAAAAAAACDDDALKLDTPVNGVMVLSLLDKIIGAVAQIQQTQTGLEARQQEMERSVTGIQGELSKLAKNHGTTSNSVNKMMEKVQKVSVNVKTVRTNLEKQGGQIRKLESNEAELLKRRNFKVMVYQDDVKVPSRLSVSKSLKVPGSVSGSRGGSMLELKEEDPAADGEEKTDKPHGEGLSSDDEDLAMEEAVEESRAERIKRSSLQRVQNLKTVFSKEKMDKTRAKTIENLGKTREKTQAKLEKTKQKTKQNLDKTRENLEKTRQKTRANLEKTRHTIEKKVGKLGTRMTVNAEQKQKMQTSRDKVKKSFNPDHVVYARDKTAVYKVPPFTFHVKKVREGAAEVVLGTEMVEVSQEAEVFQEADAEAEEGGVELEMEMMNGGEEAEEDEDLDEDEEEATQDNKDLDSD